MLGSIRVAALAAALIAVAVAPAAAQADPTPFGHVCAPENGVRFCPTTDLASRPRSFDGTPIDVDVTLPGTGNGPFPTILLLHGLGGTKASFESSTDGGRYTNRFFAEHGFAVVTPTARGFGSSCGRGDASSPGCEHGWTRLGDIRYEVRDIQTLTGQLVDEGIVDARRIAATGISYGGGFSTMLAFLRNRIVTEDGTPAPWRSPHGTPISLAAAWPRWMWSDGQGIFTRNGRAPWTRNPPGVVAQSYANGIFAVAFSGNVAPSGGDLSTDITLWKQQLDSGRIGAATRPTLDNAWRYHGVTALKRPRGGAAPLLIQSGWTDALFPVGQALGAYDAVRRGHPKAPVALQLADAGHGPGVNHPKDTAAFERQGLRFLEAWLGRPGGAKPRPGSVRAYSMVCPAFKRAGGGPFTAASYGRLATGTLRMRARRALRITSAGASPSLAQKVTGLAGAGALCTRQPIDRTSHALVQATSRGVTLLGRPRITGTVTTHGRFGQIDARVWDRSGGRQRLITRGAYRLEDNQKGRFSFTLDGNGWRFAKGHRIVVELLGRDAPTYGPSPTRFAAKLRRVEVALPLRR